MEGFFSFGISNVCPPALNNQQSNVWLTQGETSMNSTSGESCESATNGNLDVVGLKRRGTNRFYLNDYQKRILEEVFALSPYLSSHEQNELAGNLGITKQTLQNWFRNKRYRQKQKRGIKTRRFIPAEMPDYSIARRPAQEYCCSCQECLSRRYISR